MSAGLDDLVLVHREILAQAGKSRRRRGHFQVAQAALEVRLIGQHRKRRRAALLVAPGQPRRVEIRANQPFGGRCLLDLRNHRRPNRRLPPQSRHKAARGVRRRLPFQFGRRQTRLGRGYRGPRRSQNCLQASRHTLILSIRHNIWWACRNSNP